MLDRSWPSCGSEIRHRLPTSARHDPSFRPSFGAATCLQQRPHSQPAPQPPAAPRPRFRPRLSIHSGAVILLDYRRNQVKGYVGSANYSENRIDGEVHGLLGRRSPGWALKPFIDAHAIDQGLIHPRTMLKDTKLRIAAYNP